MNIIKEYRLKNNMTQQELANKAGISIRTVQSIEQNLRKPSSSLMITIFKILKIPFKDIEFFLD